MSASRCIALVLAFGCALAAAASAREATITFRLSRAFRRAQKLPTYVVWVETRKGDYVTTVRMSRTAQVQEDALRKGKPAPFFKQWHQSYMDVVEVDSITEATPWPGKSDTVKWDLTDVKGAALPKGDYVLKIECQIDGKDRDKFAQVTVMPFSIGRRTKFSRSHTVLINGGKLSRRSVYIQQPSMKIRK